MSAQMSSSFSSFKDVLLLFLIPIGGGIPAGVLKARSFGIHWPITMLLYLLSDIILAFAFEPVLKLLIFIGKNFQFFGRFREAFKKTLQKTTSQYGSSAGPLALVMIAFGVDPMTGRAAAVAAGHGFVIGWMIAITGDMMYFTVLMVSTLWLDGILGDGTKTTIVILLLMMVVPAIVRRVRDRSKK